MKITHVGAMLALFIITILPERAAAFEVVRMSETSLSDTVSMYTLTYEFGFLNADLWMPMVASRASSTRAMTYESAATRSYAVVLSDAEITDDNSYYVPKGERAEFTLLVLEEQIGPATRERKSVRVTNLPFIIERTAEEREGRRLTPEQLAPYIVWQD